MLHRYHPLLFDIEKKLVGYESYVQYSWGQLKPFRGGQDGWYGVAKAFDIQGPKEGKKDIQFLGHNRGVGGAINQSHRKFNPSLDGIITVRRSGPKEVIQTGWVGWRVED
jgi:hypothetical protein